MVFWKDAEANKLVSERVLVVDQFGSGDFSTVKDALAFRATDTDVTRRYVISVLPGSVLGYPEDNSTPLQVPGNTEIVGSGLLSTVIKASTLTQHLFETTGGNVQFRNLILYGPTTSGKACINFNGSGTNVLEYLYLSSDTGTCSVGILATAGTIYVNNCIGPGAINTVVKGAGANVLVFNTTCFNGTDAFWNNGAGLFFATGCRAISCTAAAFRNDAAGAFVSEANTALGCHTTFDVDNGSVLYANGFFEVGATTYSVRQRDVASTVFATDVTIDTRLIAAANYATVYVDAYDSFLGGKRHRRASYAAAGAVTVNDSIVAINAAAPVAMVLPGPSAGFINAQYPMKITFVIEAAAAVGSTVAPAAPDLLNGAALPIVIPGGPGGGSLTVYGIGGAWFTM